MTKFKDQKFAIVGAVVIDGTGNSPLKDGVVITEGKKILQVGPKSSVNIPPKAEVIDAKGKFLLPGLVDCHVHVFHSGFVPVPPKGSKLAYAGVIAMNNLRSALQSGVTTVRDLTSGHINLAMRTAIKRGIMIGPRCLVAGRGICMTGGHGSSSNIFGTGAHEVDGPIGVRKAIREEAKAGADLIKILTSSRSKNPEFTQEELNVAVEEAHRLGMRVAAHAGNYITTRMVSKAGVDTIEHGIAIDEETADIMEEKDITLVPTIWVLNDIRERTIEWKEAYVRSGEYVLYKERLEDTLAEYERIRKLLPRTMEIVKDRDIRIAAGSDNVRWYVPFAMLHEEIRYLTEYGLSNMEAIEAATRVGAEALGKEDEFGTIESGKYADLIMVDRDPLKDITALSEVSWVMKEADIIPLHPEWKRRPIIDGQRQSS